MMSWSQFIDSIRQDVNPLASDEHMRELVQQLQLMGEVLYLEGDPQEDLICFDPNWLCQTILGRLLSHRRVCKRHSSSNETFALNDIRNLYPEIPDPINLLQVFNAYDLCTQIDINGGYEFEFPQLNAMEIFSGLWEKRSGVHYVYIGCEIRSRTLSSLLWSVFPRIQVQLRRLIMSNEFVQHGGGDDVELFQWIEGSKLVVPRSKNTGRFRQESTGSHRNVEAVFQPENFRIFSDDFRPVPAGKHRELIGIHWKKIQ